MRVEELAIPGAYLVTTACLADERGTFAEGFRADLIAEVTGRPFAVAQINYSVSRQGTIRGIHGVAVPPGQTKYVTCVRGALRDVLVDLRVGSPTFGRHVSTVLEPATGHAVYVPDGVGHGFLALTDDACICYVVSPGYVPGTQLDLNPLDPALALPWGLTGPPILSAKDAAASTLAEALAAGLLPAWADCRPAAEKSSRPGVDARPRVGPAAAGTRNGDNR